MRDGGGFLTEDDFAAHTTAPIELVSTTFRGSTVWELPPPTQGVSVIHALEAIGASSTRSKAPRTGACDRRMGEAMAPPVSTSARSGPGRARPRATPRTSRRSISKTAAASLITSLFGDFGSHLGIPELGGPIGNRATMLRALRLPMTPGRKPPHTTIPAAVTRDGDAAVVLGVAGGFMQPQAQVQILIHMLERGLDASGGDRRAALPDRLRRGARARARSPVERGDAGGGRGPPGPEGFGAAQVVAVDHECKVTAGADPRRGGVARSRAW